MRRFGGAQAANEAVGASRPLFLCARAWCDRGGVSSRRRIDAFRIGAIRLPARTAA